MQSELEASHDEHFSSHSLSSRPFGYLMPTEKVVRHAMDTKHNIRATLPRGGTFRGRNIVLIARAPLLRTRNIYTYMFRMHVTAKTCANGARFHDIDRKRERRSKILEGFDTGDGTLQSPSGESFSHQVKIPRSASICVNGACLGLRM